MKQMILRTRSRNGNNNNKYTNENSFVSKWEIWPQHHRRLSLYRCVLVGDRKCAAPQSDFLYGHEKSVCAHIKSVMVVLYNLDNQTKLEKNNSCNHSIPHPTNAQAISTRSTSIECDSFKHFQLLAFLVASGEIVDTHTHTHISLFRQKQNNSKQKVKLLLAIGTNITAEKKKKESEL